MRVKESLMRYLVRRSGRKALKRRVKELEPLKGVKKREAIASVIADAKVEIKRKS